MAASKPASAAWEDDDEYVCCFHGSSDASLDVFLSGFGVDFKKPLAPPSSRKPPVVDVRKDVAQDAASTGLNSASVNSASVTDKSDCQDDFALLDRTPPLSGAEGEKGEDTVPSDTIPLSSWIQDMGADARGQDSQAILGDTEDRAPDEAKLMLEAENQEAAMEAQEPSSLNMLAQMATRMGSKMSWFRPEVPFARIPVTILPNYPEIAAHAEGCMCDVSYETPSNSIADWVPRQFLRQEGDQVVLFFSKFHPPKMYVCHASDSERLYAVTEWMQLFLELISPFGLDSRTVFGLSRSMETCAMIAIELLLYNGDPVPSLSTSAYNELHEFIQVEMTIANQVCAGYAHRGQRWWYNALWEVSAHQQALFFQNQTCMLALMLNAVAPPDAAVDPYARHTAQATDLFKSMRIARFVPPVVLPAHPPPTCASVLMEAELNASQPPMCDVPRADVQPPTCDAAASSSSSTSSPLMFASAPHHSLSREALKDKIRSKQWVPQPDTILHPRKHRRRHQDSGAPVVRFAADGSSG